MKESFYNPRRPAMPEYPNTKQQEKSEANQRTGHSEHEISTGKSAEIPEGEEPQPLAKNSAANDVTQTFPEPEPAYTQPETNGFSSERWMLPEENENTRLPDDNLAFGCVTVRETPKKTQGIFTPKLPKIKFGIDQKEYLRILEDDAHILCLSKNKKEENKKFRGRKPQGGLENDERILNNLRQFNQRNSAIRYIKELEDSVINSDEEELGIPLSKQKHVFKVHPEPDHQAGSVSNSFGMNKKLNFYKNAISSFDF
uniref:Uncharacterized protein n=1 Tax=Euplotes harpa TaxID=151035 RepID=A0A7S3NGR1_9SPIT|mmetsp:Transcript_4853/g.5747  ORF Transcript_4853/g.5747 Transcript_4853/m.5747 type:complete len:256 (+) Transcript_4853:96-863(+)